MSRASIDSVNSRRWSVSALSNENLDSLHKMVPMRNGYYSSTNSFFKHGNGNGSGNSRPIAFSKFPHKHVKRAHKFDIIKHFQPKGLIFVWPQKRNFYYEREYSIVIRIMAQILYWFNEIGLFPSGTGLPIKKPPWLIKLPIPKPEVRDYIIEPDWNSINYDN